MANERIETYEEETARAVNEAQTMVRLFENVGVVAFGVTRKKGQKVTRFVRYEPARLRDALPWLLDSTASNEESLIIRPSYPPETERAIVQVDDLNYDRANHLARFAFCITETSPANYQAFVCLPDGATDYARLRRGMNAASEADKGATCAARIAGSVNFKKCHSEAYFHPRRQVWTYPRVKLALVASGRTAVQEDLRAAGLLVDVVEKPPVDVLRFRRRGPAPRRIPSYAKALASVGLKSDGTPNRSKADLLFAVTCLRWRPPLNPEEIAALLLEHSEKAQERADAERYVEQTIQAAMQRA